MDKYITTPITEEKTAELHAGDYVYITGTIYVARDAAHKRMMEVLERGEELPIDILDSTIYYMGPSPAREAVYFAAIGGAGALLSKCITKSEIVCYEDLGAEAIRKLEVKDFPVIVVIDRDGNNLYETAIEKYKKIQL